MARAFILGVVVAFTMLLSGPAHAGGDFYLYGAIGLTSNFHINQSERDAFAASIFPNNAPIDISESMLTEADSNPAKVAAGYWFSQHFGLELSAANLGRTSYFAQQFDRPSPSVIRQFTLREEWKARAYSASVLGRIPVAEGFYLFGRAGAARATMQFKRNVNLNGALSDESASETKWVPTAGLGLEWDIIGRLPIGLRLEYERFRNVGNDATIGKRDVDVTSLGILFRF